MRYELMIPAQIRDAIERNVPVVLPLGVLEFHGEHLAVGMDTLAVTRTAEALEREMEMVLLPAFYYGAGSYVVEPPEGRGTVQVGPDGLVPFARQLFASLLRIGFRNVHGFIHHQSENFVAGMPTDLSFKLAAKQATFDLLGREPGEGWWGDNSMASYYEDFAEGDNPFNWIQIHPLMDEKIIAEYDFDHAGIGETSLMMALCPEGVHMDRFSEEKWYSRSAKNASAEYGQKAATMVKDRMRRVLEGKLPY